MCSSGGQHLCSGCRASRPPQGPSLGVQYALCALGVGLVALGVVLIVWNMVPAETASAPHNATTTAEEGGPLQGSSVSFVLVGSGLAVLLLAICLGMRNKRRSRGAGANAATTTLYTHGVQQAPHSTHQPGPTYAVPSYEEAVTSGQYPVRQSNLRQSTSQLPSYEDLITAVENEGERAGEGSGQNAPDPAPDPTPGTTTPSAAGANANANANANAQPVRSGSRASRLLKPLRVRRIKSEKLHAKEIRLKIENPPQGGERVTIEPLTPPPQYEDKMPELTPEGE